MSEMDFGPACSAQEGAVVLAYLRELVTRGKADNIEAALRSLAAAGPLSTWPKPPLLLAGPTEARELLWWLDCAVEQKKLPTVGAGLRALAAGTAPSITLTSESR